MRIEIRKCVLCEEQKPIPQKFKYATNVCVDCSRSRQREYQREQAKKEGKRIGTTGRVPYPLKEGETTPTNKFKLLGRRLFKIKNREEWIIEMRKRLEEVFRNEEVMRWINAHDSEEVKSKRDKRKNTNLPDTRNLNWDDWEEGGWGDEVDS
jgi:hypothetical protein